MHHILVAEDDPLVIYLMTEALQSEGYTVTQTRDGAQALRALQDETPDLILTDILMPEMDGFTLLQKVRESHPDLPVIAMSPPSLRQRAAKAGFTHVIKKPFLLREMLRQVVRAIRCAGPNTPSRGPSERISTGRT